MIYGRKKIKSKTGLEYASRLLSKRDYSEKDLRKKITEHFGAEEADETIVKLKGYGYLDDDRYREVYIQSRLRMGYGPYRISGDLYEKGLDDDLSDLDEICEKSHIDRHAILRDNVRNYLQRKNIEDAYELSEKCKAYFYRRGHSLSDVKKLIDEELDK
jgi:regulatory protein